MYSKKFPEIRNSVGQVAHAARKFKYSRQISPDASLAKSIHQTRQGSESAAACGAQLANDLENRRAAG